MRPSPAASDDGSRRPLRRGLALQIRLTISIATLFVVAAAALLWVEYGLVSAFLERAVAGAAPSASIYAGSVAESQGGDPSASPEASASDDASEFAAAGSDAAGDGEDEVLEYSITAKNGGGGELQYTSGEALATADSATQYTVTVRALTDYYTHGVSPIADEVTRSLLIASLGILVAFAVVGTGCAHLIARRSLRRLGLVTALARDVSHADLSGRLRLDGPRDDIQQLGDAFDRMLDRLQDAFEAQDRFVANASHELRTPITTTRAALEIPLDQGRVPSDLEPAVRRALAANARSEQLIAALLALARARGQVQDRCDLDLAEIARAAADEAEPAAAARSVSLHTDLDCARATAAPVLARLVADNLVSNAVRHNRAGGEVWVEAGEEDGGAFLSVANTGADLTDEEVASLAEPFSRGGASRVGDDEGVGLGLSIVAAVTEAHDGDLEILAREGGGLIVSVWLPGGQADDPGGRDGERQDASAGPASTPA